MKTWRASAEFEKELDGKHEIKLLIVGLVSFPIGAGLVVLVLYAAQEGWIF